MSIALLPCPFCGGEPHIERHGTPRVSMIIVCDDCGCTLESSDTMGSALFAGHGLCWNRRFNVALDIYTQRDELREALQALLDARSRTAMVVLAAQKNAFDVLARTEPKP